MGHERLDRRLIQSLDGNQADVADLISAASQEFFGIGKSDAADEAEADVPSGDHYRENGFGGAVGWSEANDKEVIVIVHHFDSAGKPRAHLVQSESYLRRDLGCVLR